MIAAHVCVAISAQASVSASQARAAPWVQPLAHVAAMDLLCPYTLCQRMTLVMITMTLVMISTNDVL